MPQSDEVRRQAQTRPYRRQRNDPQTRPLKIFTLDSTTARTDGAVATIEVPWEPLGRGPQGSVFFVDPADENGVPLPAVDLDDPRLLISGGVSPSVSDHHFHQQMLYAVSSKLYAQFRSALGRSVAWGFDASAQGGRLRIRPHERLLGANAEYNPEKGQVAFGAFNAGPSGRGRVAPNGQVFACLSHDVIAHEITHALVDGLRSHFTVPTSHDVMGFHEGFADIVAVFQHFTYKEVIESQLRKLGGDLDHASLLTDIAQQFGEVIQGKALRCAVGDNPKHYQSDLEAHEMGSVLLQAVFGAFVRVFKRKVEPFVRLAYRPPTGAMPAELVTFLASKASSLASQFLDMCIRAIDYCPPVDMQLGEFLRAIVTVDHELVPDDPWGYRDAFIASFAERGIYPAGVDQLAEDSLIWRTPSRYLEPCRLLSYSHLGFAGDPSMPAEPEELSRQADALYEYMTRPKTIEEFGLAPAGRDGVEPPCVESIRTTRRVGPDGELLLDLVAEVTQRRTVLDPETKLQTKFFGGSTVILGPEGEVRYIIVKHVMSTERLNCQFRFQRLPEYWEPDGGRLKMKGYSHLLAHRKAAESAQT